MKVAGRLIGGLFSSYALLSFSDVVNQYTASSLSLIVFMNSFDAGIQLAKFRKWFQRLIVAALHKKKPSF